MPELKIGSSLNFANVNELLKDAALTDANDAVLLDLSSTEHVDSAGVALILHWLSLCEAKGIEFSLRGVSGQLQALFDVYELNDVFSR